MKLAMNGALTIGTLDGANIELLDEVGAENISFSALTVDDIRGLRAGGNYRPQEWARQNPHVQRIFDALASNLFCPDEPGLLRWIGESICDHGDMYFHVGDLPAYIETQRRVSDEFGQPAVWCAKAILNVARIGLFSSDRAVAEYARDIWQIGRVED